MADWKSYPEFPKDDEYHMVQFSVDGKTKVDIARYDMLTHKWVDRYDLLFTHTILKWCEDCRESLFHRSK